MGGSPLSLLPPGFEPEEDSNPVSLLPPGFEPEQDGGELRLEASHKPTFNSRFDTILNPQEERGFQDWKSHNAPGDSGEDYDLRGAFKSGVRPDSLSGHFPDTFKKPNHPTFSDESQYAQYGRPGHWEGDKFIAPVPPKPSTSITNPPSIPRESRGTTGTWEPEIRPTEPSTAERIANTALSSFGGTAPFLGTPGDRTLLGRAIYGPEATPQAPDYERGLDLPLVKPAEVVPNVPSAPAQFARGVLGGIGELTTPSNLLMPTGIGAAEAIGGQVM